MSRTRVGIKEHINTGLVYTCVPVCGCVCVAALCYVLGYVYAKLLSVTRFHCFFSFLPQRNKMQHSVSVVNESLKEECYRKGCNKKRKKEAKALESSGIVCFIIYLTVLTRTSESFLTYDYFIMEQFCRRLSPPQASSKNQIPCSSSL